VPHVAKKRQIDTVLSNSFGFGGTNASVVLKRLDV
jgi:3-oxoacyl-[acyl-carrier-protein] synthase II